MEQLMLCPDAATESISRRYIHCLTKKTTNHNHYYLSSFHQIQNQALVRECPSKQDYL
jgi:hypothetical protein